jgi:hypothetical protein
MTALFRPFVEVLEGRWVPTTLTPTTLLDGGLGSGSLRDAVLQFNADTGTDDDLIQLEAGTYSLTIQNVGGRHETAGLTGDLNLTQTSHRWIIQGAGPSTIIDASQLQDRVFQVVNPGTQVVFRDLVIQGGLAQDNGADGALAGTTDALGGGILNNGGDVTLDNVVLQNNGAQGGDAAVRTALGHNALGGGIYSTGGALTIAGATIANNQATGGGGGASSHSQSAGAGGSASGGGLYASGGSLDISVSGFANNRATGGRGGDGHVSYTFYGNTFGFGGGPGGTAQGGGLYVSGGSLTVVSSTLASDQGTGGSPGVGASVGSSVAQGGGLYIFSNAGTPAVTGSTLSENSATYDGGGIYNQGTLTVSDSTLSGNSGGGAGGGIYNQGTLTVSDSTLSGNSAGGGGGIKNGGTLTVSDSTLSSNSVGAGSDGGGIDNQGTLTVSNSTLSENSAGYYGGGIYNYSGTVTVSNSTVSGNYGGNAGGIFNYGTVTVSNSTLSGNSEGVGQGGGIFNYEGTLTVSNSTLSANSAGGGGGILTYSFDPVTLTNVTLTANRATFYGGGLEVINGSPVLHNTLIAGNSSGSFNDVYGSLDPSGSYNLIGDGTGMTGLSNGVNGNQVGSSSAPIDPLLGPLQDNGGPTLTHALLSGSPAIDAGNNAYATDWDQRGPGYPRIVNGIIDIGAFEVQAPAASYPTRQPLPATVPVQALGMPGGSVLGQPPDPLASPSPSPGSGIPDGQAGQPEPVPVPTATGQQAPATLLDTYPGTGQPLASLDSWSASDLDALALNMLGGP